MSSSKQKQHDNDSDEEGEEMYMPTFSMMGAAADEEETIDSGMFTYRSKALVSLGPASASRSRVEEAVQSYDTSQENL